MIYTTVREWYFIRYKTRTPNTLYTDDRERGRKEIDQFAFHFLSWIPILSFLFLPNFRRLVFPTSCHSYTSPPVLSMDFSFSGIFLFLTFLSYLRFVSSSPSPTLCPHQSHVFRNGILSQCPLEISPIPPLEVDGNFLDRVMNSKQKAYISVLFYASWCPFSRNMHPKFEVLSSMFPQIEHLAVEQSVALPSVFSRYGIHSLPSILVVNQTSRVRYRGPKDLLSLVQFYEKTTGLQPIQYLAEDELMSLADSNKSTVQLWSGSSTKGIMKKEPYLVYTMLFLIVKVLMSIFPEVLSRLKAFWFSYVPHLNLEIFGETNQLFERVLNMIDVRRVWTKLRFCKTRNFHAGAKNARVWASSLASVSLGEPSSARSSS